MAQELKRRHINEVMDMHNITRGQMGYSFVYYADDVDAVLAEKDSEIAKLKSDLADMWDNKRDTDKLLDERNAEIARLNDELQAAIDNMQNAEATESRLKRALYKVIANWIKTIRIWDGSKPADDYDKWHNMERRCLIMADKFKK